MGGAVPTLERVQQELASNPAHYNRVWNSSFLDQGGRVEYILDGILHVMKTGSEKFGNGKLDNNQEAHEKEELAKLPISPALDDEYDLVYFKLLGPHFSPTPCVVDGLSRLRALLVDFGVSDEEYEDEFDEDEECSSSRPARCTGGGGQKRNQARHAHRPGGVAGQRTPNHQKKDRPNNSVKEAEGVTEEGGGNGPQLHIVGELGFSSAFNHGQKYESKRQHYGPLIGELERAGWNVNNNKQVHAKRGYILMTDQLDHGPAEEEEAVVYYRRWWACQRRTGPGKLYNRTY
eukprot:1188921-Prorocentrum_minimum.AAC.2